jgi:cell division protein ZipA
MSELRWILLIAGALLIAGIYFWGLRSRSRSKALDQEARRPAVFTGTASAFETPRETAGATTAVDPETPGGTGGTRRIEPSVSLDDDIDSTPAIERRAEFRDDPDARGSSQAAPLSRGRREPTLTGRTEPAVTGRPESSAPVRSEPTLAPRHEPIVDTSRPAPAGARADGPTNVAAASATSPGTSPAPAAPAETAKPKRPPQKIFAVRVTASGTSRLSGERVIESLHAEGLQFGKYQIFHRLHDNGRPVFSVASLRDPGTFDLQEMPQTQYPGVLVFVVLPGPVQAGEAFDEMLFTARALATHLGGTLADEQGTPLTAQRAGQMRAEALDFERTVSGAA